VVGDGALDLDVWTATTASNRESPRCDTLSAINWHRAVIQGSNCRRRNRRFATSGIRGLRAFGSRIEKCRAGRCSTRTTSRHRGGRNVRTSAHAVYLRFVRFAGTGVDWRGRRSIPPPPRRGRRAPRGRRAFRRHAPACQRRVRVKFWRRAAAADEQRRIVGRCPPPRSVGGRLVRKAEGKGKRQNDALQSLRDLPRPSLRP
jgi:hypothetical protein